MSDGPELVVFWLGILAESVLMLVWPVVENPVGAALVIAGVTATLLGFAVVCKYTMCDCSFLESAV